MFSCANSQISGINKIYANALSSLEGTTITSNGTSLFVSFASYRAGDPTKIICSKGDSCYIECVTSTACQNVSLTCYGDYDCTVNCEPLHYQIQCPDWDETSTGIVKRITLIPTMTPTHAPSQYPTQIPTTSPTMIPTKTPSNPPTESPSLAPTTSPTGIPTRVPSEAPSIAPTNIPTAAPTNAPTDSPTDNGTSITNKELWIYYNEEIDERQLSIQVYAKELEIAAQEAFLSVLNATLLNKLCEQKNVVVDGNYSVYGEFDDEYLYMLDYLDEIDCGDNKNNDGSTERRHMLEPDYSYSIINESNSWWQGRIDNLQFCVVLKYVWSPTKCDKYESWRFPNSSQYINNKATYVAFGTFDIVADTNVFNFQRYFEKMLQLKNGSLFLQALDKNMMKQNHSSFKAVYVSIQHFDSPQTLRTESLIEKIGLDIQFSLCGFVVFCILVAFIAKMHAFCSKADNVEPIRIVLFGVWTWDVMSDILFAITMFSHQQGNKYFWHGVLSVIFVVLPWCLNMKQLIRSQNQWTNDPILRFSVARWLLKNNKKLIVGTALCGSCYAVIEMCNSRAFGK